MRTPLCETLPIDLRTRYHCRMRRWRSAEIPLALLILAGLGGACGREPARTLARPVTTAPLPSGKSQFEVPQVSTAAPQSPAAPPGLVNVPTTATGPAWVRVGGDQTVPLAYSSNGLWYAMFVSGGVLLGDSTTALPLAVAPVAFDKAIALGFHPDSKYLVTVFDFAVLIWTIEVVDNRIALTGPSLLPAPDLPWLLPPAFDRTGKYLALFDTSGAIMYDFDRRRPLLHVIAGLERIDAASFSADTLFFAQATTEPCNCDDYRGSDGRIALFRLGGKTVRTLPTMGDLNAPLSMRQGKIATIDGLWDARTGRRLVRWQNGNRAYGVARLRASGSSLLTTDSETHAVGFELVSDQGFRRRVAEFGELVGPVSVRPQDDVIHFLEDRQSTLLFHRIGIEHGTDSPVPIPESLCVDAGAVLTPAACTVGGPQLQSYRLQEPVPVPDDLPVVLAPTAPTRGRLPRPIGYDYD